MTLGKALKIIGFVLIAWAVISSFYFSFSFGDGDFSFRNGFTFKAGGVLLGILLIFLGKKANEA